MLLELAQVVFRKISCSDVHMLFQEKKKTSGKHCSELYTLEVRCVES